MKQQLVYDYRIFKSEFDRGTIDKSLVKEVIIMSPGFKNAVSILTMEANEGDEMISKFYKPGAKVLMLDEEKKILRWRNPGELSTYSLEEQVYPYNQIMIFPPDGSAPIIIRTEKK